MPITTVRVAPTRGTPGVASNAQRKKKPAHTTRSRFTLAKAEAFFDYTKSTARLRHLAVVLCFPLPGVLTAILLSAIPLQSPARGVLDNWGILLHHGMVNWIAMSTGLIQARAASAVNHSELPTLSIWIVSLVGAAHCPLFFILLGSVWQFPVPFYVAISPWTYLVFLVWAYLLLYQVGLLHISREVRAKLFKYAPALALQVSQLALYPCYSTMFAAANEWQQILLVVLFPCLKYVLKRLIFTVSRSFGDFAKEIAVCGVEITASMYQATIMQTTPSALVSAFVIGVDVVLSVFEIKHYLDRKTIVSTAELIERAEGIIKNKKSQLGDRKLSKYGTHATSIFREFRTRVLRHDASRRADSIVPSVDSGAAVVSDQIVAAQALELLQAAESILLVEYLEVTVPIMNACLLVVASQLPSSRYNLATRPFHLEPSTLVPAVASIMLYTSLQAVTLLGMVTAMRIRYRLSAMRLLAFVLETHAWSLQGKLILWMPVTLAIPILHYGADFTFKFDYRMWN